MANIFGKIELKYPPDFVLVFSGAFFMAVLGALIKDVNLPGGTLSWLVMVGGIFSFGLAYKNAHYRRHDKTIYKWVNDWRNNWLSSLFIVLSVCLLTGSAVLFRMNT